MGSGVVGSLNTAHSNEKHIGGARFLTEKGSQAVVGRKHIFPPQGNDCCMQSLLLLKEAAMRGGKIDSGVNKLPAPTGLPL